MSKISKLSVYVPNMSEAELLAELFDSIGEGRTEYVRLLLTYAKETVELLKKKDPQGLTPLRKAIALSKPEIARILVHHGAEPSVRDPAGRTPLHIAVMQGRRDLIAPLLVSRDSCVNVQDAHGWTPLHFAVRGKHVKAISWLLYAGADVNLKNKEDKTPIEICDEDDPIKEMLEAHLHSLDDGPLDLCSAFIGRKQLNQIGPDGLLMYVTSSIWSEKMQFIFCIRIRPYRAMPPIPLRQDEQFYSDVWHYRMMRRLNRKETRVKAYFRMFEELFNTEVVLKITSKTRFLGEVPVTLSKYTQFNYTSYLACAELDLKDEGQFVMVKRTRPGLLLKDDDGVYSHKRFPNFKFNLPDGSLPDVPNTWDATRRDRAEQEAKEMMFKIMPLPEKKESEKQVVWVDENTNADVAESEHNDPEKALSGEAESVEEGEGQEGEEDEEEGSIPEDDWPGGIRPGTMLEGDEPDDCTDFYFISRGWGLYLEGLPVCPLSKLMDPASYEKNLILCSTPFYRIYHSSKKHPTATCTVQIPKTQDFVRHGTVLVFMRRDIGPDDVDFPDPDDAPEEHFLSQDGKNTWGTFWTIKERERWSLLPAGIVNKISRVIFETNKLTTYVIVQLTIGNQKAEYEDANLSSSESEEDETGLAEDGAEESERVSPAGEASDGEDEATTRRKKKKRDKVQMVIKLPDSDEDSTPEESADDELTPAPEHEPPRLSADMPGTVRPSVIVSDEGSMQDTLAPMSPVLQQNLSKRASGASSSLAVSKSKSVARKPDGRSPSMGSSTNLANNNSSNRNQSRLVNRNYNAEESSSSFDEDETRLRPEQRTVVVALPPIPSSYYALSGMEALRRPKRVEPRQEEVLLEEAMDEALPLVEEAEDKGGEEVGEGENEEVEPEEKESEEVIPYRSERHFSIASIQNGVLVPEKYVYGPPLTETTLTDAELLFIGTEVATLWRHRNHCEAIASIFTRLRSDASYDMVIELVKNSELYVRAEHWWGEGYRMVAQSSTFPAKSGRYFSFTLDGPMIVDSPVSSNFGGGISVQSVFYYLSTVCCLQYVVKKPCPKDEDVKVGAKKGAKKKDDSKADSEPDAVLEITAYPHGTRSHGVDIATLGIFLQGHDLWHQRHVELRMSDNILLTQLTKCLKKERAFKHEWWRVVLFLGYQEKEIETEKGKTKWSAIIVNYLNKWFGDNLNAPDRGILRLVSMLDMMGLEATIERMLLTIRTYKGDLLLYKREPRYLKLLFHWVLSTKITRNNLLRMIDTQILKPVSDLFLLRLSELLDPELLYKIGSCMDVEDNVIHAIRGEEIIKDPVYQPFKVLIKSRQKKDEIIHYSLLLMEMVKACEMHAAKNFVVTETRKWMVTVADTDPDICAKLENVFGQL